MTPTDGQALKAAKVLLEYYRECARLAVIDPFFDGMVIRLSNEIDRLSKRSKGTR